MILHNLIIAVRNILKHKVQNLISILGLSVALLCFSVCLYCSRYIYNIDNCFTKKERIAEFGLYFDSNYVSGVPADLITKVTPHISAHVETTTRMTYARERDYNLEIDNKQLPYSLKVIEVDTTFQRVFTPQVIYGSWETAQNTPNAIILSESTAQKMFGNPRKAIGKQMVLTRRLFSSPSSTHQNGGIAYTIQAVIKDMPGNNSLAFMTRIDALAMNDSEGMLRGNHRPGSTGTLAYALLKEGTDMEPFVEKIKKDKLTISLWGQDCEVVAYPIGQVFWDNYGVKPQIYITSIIGFLILLVGMLNFFHFLTGSYMTRIREYSLRSVNGAKGRHIWGMLSVQSALLIIACGLFTGLFMELLAPYLRLKLNGFTLVIEYPLLLQQTVGYLGGLLVLCMLTSCLIVWKTRRSTILQGLFGGHGVYGKHRIRNVLLGIQLFISWIFISLTFILYLQAEKSSKTIFETLSIEEKEEIFSIPMEYTFISTQEKRTLVEGMRSLPGVKDILIADIPYNHGTSGNLLYSEKGNKKAYIEIPLHRVTPNFFSFMQIPIRSGKAIEGPSDMVVDAALERHYQKEMTGMTFSNTPDFNDIYTVTGISEPFIVSTQKSARGIDGFAFLSDDFNDYFGHCYVKCHPGEKEKAKAALEAFLRERLPENIETEVSTLLDDIRNSQLVEFKFKGVIGFMALVALTISLLGIYSAITLDTEYRQKEVAIRKINGAGMKDIVLLFARLYVVLLVVTFALAVPIVSALAKTFSQQYAVFIDMGFGFYAFVFLCIAAIVALTVGFRIYRVTQINPAMIIKKE